MVYAFKLNKVNHVLGFHHCFIFSGNFPTWHCAAKVTEVLCPQYASADGIALCYYVLQAV